MPVVPIVLPSICRYKEQHIATGYTRCHTERHDYAVIRYAGLRYIGVVAVININTRHQDLRGMIEVVLRVISSIVLKHGKQ